jgi:hypothetical protein
MRYSGWPPPPPDPLFLILTEGKFGRVPSGHELIGYNPGQQKNIICFFVRTKIVHIKRTMTIVLFTCTLHANIITVSGGLLHEYLWSHWFGIMLSTVSYSGSTQKYRRMYTNLADAKNAVVHVDHTTCLDCCDQLVNERRCPMVSSSGNRTILLVSGIEGCRLDTPFSIRERTGSLGVSTQCRPFRWCTNFTARM